MIKVVSRRTIKKEFIQEVLALYQEMIQESRKEVGCVSYEMYVDVDDPNTIVFIEEWEEKKHLDAHAKSAHYQKIIPQVLMKQRSSDLRFLERCEE